MPSRSAIRPKGGRSFVAARVFTVRLPEPLLRRADDVYHAMRLRSRNALIVRAVEEFLRRLDSHRRPTKEAIQ